VLNQIGSVLISAARPLFFDRYADNRATGSFILIDPSTNFTAGAGMISAAVGEEAAGAQRSSIVERITRTARAAATEAEAIAAVRQALEELLL
jgi:sulfate adenylyltransferase subunit 1 (EFTu-like GTPase family)